MLASGKPVASTNYQYRSFVGTWGVGATSGQITVDMADSYAITYKIATMTSPKVGIRVEGKFGDKRWANLYTASINAAMTIDEVINSEVGVSYIRLGFRAQDVTATTDNVVYADLLVSE
jgi:hypothetical protein